MILINGTMDIDTARRPEFVSAVRSLVSATRTEPGCLAYVISPDLDDEGRFHIFEQWESGDALKGHMRADAMAAFKASLPDLGLLANELHRHEVPEPQS